MARCIILRMTTTWNKHSYICPTCDGSFEMTINSYRTIDQELCPSCFNTLVLLSVADATIYPTNEREQMETTTYDANVLVTYKDIVDGVATYQTLKVNELEWKLERIKRLEQQLEISNGQIRQILDNLSADGWYNPNYEKAEVLNDLCEILGHEPKQEIRITGTINFEVRYDCPLDEIEDFDARYFMQDNLSLDSFHGDIVIDTYDVDDVDVEY